MRDPSFFLHDFAPVTTHLAFLDLPVGDLAAALFTRTEDLMRLWELPWQVQKQHVQGGLAHKLDALLPLTSVRSTKTLLSATRSPWTAYIPNGHRGGDVHTEPSWLAERLRARALTVILTEDVPPEIPGSIQFVLHDATTGSMKSRAIAAHRESRWEFSADGEPLPFEELDRYSARKIRDRLTIEMVERYCRHLGIALLDPDFYAGDGYIIHSYPPPNATFFHRFPNR